MVEHLQGWEIRIVGSQRGETERRRGKRIVLVDDHRPRQGTWVDLLDALRSRFLREATKHRIERVGGRAFVDVADDNDLQDVPGKQVRVHCLEVTYGDPRDRLGRSVRRPADLRLATRFLDDVRAWKAA